MSTPSNPLPSTSDISTIPINVNVEIHGEHHEPNTSRSFRGDHRGDSSNERPISTARSGEDSSDQIQPQQPPSNEQQRNSLTQRLEEEELKYGANHVIKLFVPVSICMLMVIASIRSLTFYTQTSIYLPYTPYTDQTVDTTTRVWQSFANAFIMISVVALMTVVLIVFYKLRFYKLIHGWLVLSSSTLLLMFVSGYITEILKRVNLPTDSITMYFLMWNIGGVGMVSIHLTGPLLLQQAYLLIMSCMMALSFLKFIPDWSIWTVLAILSVWDVIAVLCPRGPLRILVETAQKRNEPIFPALIYSSGVMYVSTVASTVLGLGRSPGNSSSTTTNPAANVEEGQSSPTVNRPSTSGIQIQTNPLASLNTDNLDSRQANSSSESIDVREIDSSNLLGQANQAEQPCAYFVSSPSIPEITFRSSQQRSNRTESAAVTSRTQMIRATDDASDASSETSLDDVGIKLGLGDFIFYSVLVGKASMSNDWNTTLACFVAILIGLCLTLFLLAIFNKALPALPISITFGLIFYFSTSIFVQPLFDRLTLNHIFV